MQAQFNGAKGQAFTDTYGNYRGRLADIAHLDLAEPMSQAIFVATLNAVMQPGPDGLHDPPQGRGPAECSRRIAEHICGTHGQPKIGMVGYQPAMIGALSGQFEIRVLDLDPDNIGQVKHSADRRGLGHG